MPLILAIETATEACSVALVRDGEVLVEKTVVATNVHAAKLTLFIEDLMQETGLAFADLNGVAISKGPGSYTGLRIGVATAKGLCYALDIPLLAVNTLEAMVHKLLREQGAAFNDRDFLFCPMIDARRMEVYTAFYDAALNEHKATSADILDEDSYAAYFAKNRLVFFGNGAAKCKNLSSFTAQGIFVDDFYGSAASVGLLAEQRLLQGKLEDVAYFEPFYLKDFMVGGQPASQSNP